jgi:hypothetical protein
MYSQIHEWEFFGGSNYIGDVGPTTYIAPNEPALEYYINGTKSTTCLFSYTQSKITSNDLDSKEPSRKSKVILKIVKEVSLGLEFNFSILTFMN